MERWKDVRIVPASLHTGGAAPAFTGIDASFTHYYNSDTGQVDHKDSVRWGGFSHHLLGLKQGPSFSCDRGAAGAAESVPA